MEEHPTQVPDELLGDLNDMGPGEEGPNNEDY